MASTFGSILKSFRRLRHLSQEALAEKVGYSSSYIGQLERGKKQPASITVTLLAQALNLSDDDANLLEKISQNNLQTLHLPSIPLPLSSLIDRSQLVQDILSLFEQNSSLLLTLTGVAGIGKTCLALQIGKELHDVHKAILFLPLEHLKTSQDIWTAISHQLGLTSSNESEVVDDLVTFFGQDPFIIILDNFEHPIDAAPQLAGLLEKCPRLHLVVTSRIPLRLRGESLLQVPALSVPPAHISGEVFWDYGAVILFVERAKKSKPGWSPNTAEEQDAIGQIVRRLDGIPLAIELAAARISSLSVIEIQTSLRDPLYLSLLSSGPRDLPFRQQSLTQAFNWSYRLLNAAEQGLFRRLSVFSGSMSVEAIHKVILPNESRVSVIIELASLIESNLVGTISIGEKTNYSLLQTIGQFARELLLEAKEQDYYEKHHAYYYIAWGEEVETKLEGSAQQLLFEEIEQEMANIRIAIRWCQLHDEWEKGLRLVVALGRFWDIRGYRIEGREYLQKNLLKPIVDTELYIRALRWAGLLALRMGDITSATIFVEQALNLNTNSNATKATLFALYAHIASIHGRHEDAQKFDENVLRLYQTEGDTLASAVALANIGVDLMQQGKYSEAIIHFHQSLEENSDDLINQASNLTNIASALCRLGKYEEAVLHAKNALDIAKAIKAPSWIAACLDNTGDILLRK